MAYRQHSTRPSGSARNCRGAMTGKRSRAVYFADRCRDRERRNYER